MHIVMLETTVPRGFDHVQTLAAAGVQVSFVTEDLRRYAEQPGFEQHGRATRTIELPATKDVADLADQLRGRLPEPVDGVICVHDQYVVAAHRLARDLGVPHEPLDTIRLLRDKSAVRQRLTEAGIGSLRWRRVNGARAGRAAAAELGYPVVVKPLGNYGSIGVGVAWEPAQLGDLLAAVAGPMLIEQYAIGRHVSAELLVQDGAPMILGFAERLPAPPGVTAELGGHFPARFEGMGAARRFVTELVRALGVRNIALHVELLITASGPELIEVNARVAGHVVSEQLSLALGRSITLDLLALATGRPLAPLEEPVRVLALRHFWSPRAGVLRAVSMPPLPAQVVRCEAVVRPGSVVRPLRHNFDRLGYVLAQAHCAHAAIEAAATVAAQVRIELADGVVEAAECVAGLAAGGVDPVQRVAGMERTLRFRHTAQDRTHVLIVDRFGPAGWTRPDGQPVLPADQFRVTVISSHPTAPGEGPAQPDGYLSADVFDRSVLFGLADAVHAAHPVHRVACGTEHLLEAAGELRARWGVPGNGPERIRAVRDKAEMKRIARAAGIPHAAGGVLYESAEADRLLDACGAIVVKPRDRSGAQGVRVLRTRDELRRWSREAFRPGAYLVEEFQPGAVCHIDAVVHRGVLAWEVSQYGADALGFAAGHPVLSWTVDDDRLRANARELLDRVLAGWDISAGVLHLEAFDAGDHLVFNELAGRAGGGGIGATFRSTQGIDLRHAQLVIDAGADPRRLRGEPVGAFAGWIVHYSPGGRLLAFDDSAVADHAVHRELNAQVGDEVPPAAFRGTGLATYAFAADSPQRIRRLLRLAATDIKIHIGPTLLEPGCGEPAPAEPVRDQPTEA